MFGMKASRSVVHRSAWVARGKRRSSSLLRGFYPILIVFILCALWSSAGLNVLLSLDSSAVGVLPIDSSTVLLVDSSVNSTASTRITKHKGAVVADQAAPEVATAAVSRQPFTDDKGGGCQFYLAPASLYAPGTDFAGFGVFTASPIRQHESLFHKWEGPTVQILDPLLHNEERPEWADTIFMWTVRSHIYKESDEGYETSPNLGTMINHHDLVYNCQVDREDTYYNDTILNRFTDPGAGAISYHTGRKWKAERDIAAGEEIFDNYGESYIRSRIRLSDGDLSKIPEVADYKKAQMEFKRFQASRNATLIDDAALQRLQQDATEKYGALTASLLPSNMKEFQRFLDIRKCHPTFSIEQSMGMMKLRDTTPEWLQENGRCLDAIIPGPSTIKQAGQGAIARLFMPKGSVVVPVPLLVNAVNSSSMNMVKLKSDSFNKAQEGEPIGQQLLVNYCYGHHESSVILCAGSNANLINHCSTRMEGPCGSQGPNARIQWATEFDPKTPEWLKKTPREIKKLLDKGIRGLSMEVIATRDILPGEEVFIDYGVHWEEAWKSHVANWHPPAKDSGFDSYASVTEMNGKLHPVRTKDELEANPYPVNVKTICHHSGWKKCTVLSRICPDDNRSQSNCVFKVEVHLDEGISNKKTVSRHHILFTMRKYSSDQHLPGAFRHFIGVPDEMWPEQWKNRRDEVKSSAEETEREKS